MKCIFVSDINGMPERGGELAGHLPEDVQLCCLTLTELALAPGLTSGNLHRHLIQEGGMELASRSLLEQHGDATMAVGFSAGGTVLWQACLAGLDCADLICLSSTRLRDETRKPLARTHVIFDQADASPANTVSARGLPDRYYLTGNQGHTAYLDPNSKMNRLAEKILRDVSRRKAI